MAFRAAVEPMLIRESKMQTTREMEMALRGMFHLG